MGVFEKNAPAYWEAGLPVIPLWPKKKNPALQSDWQQFCQRMPTESEKHQWLAVHSEGNVGLPLGPCSGLVAFDVDTVEPAVLEIIEQMLPVKSPWKRVGAKGYVAVFKYNGEKTFRIKNMEGQTLCELLSLGTQIVLPPSIHPDTGLPYIANVDLCEVAKRVPTLPLDFEKSLRGALTTGNVKLSVSGYSRLTEFVPKSSRDTRYTSICGIYARDVIRGGITMVEAIKAVEVWPTTFAENVDGDNVDPKDGVRKLVRFIIKNVREHGDVLPKDWDNGLTDQDKEALGLDFSPDEQEQSFTTIETLLRAEMDEAATSDAKMDVVKKCLQRISRSPSLEVGRIELLLRACSALSGLRLTLTSLKKDLQKLRNSGLEGTNHAEIAEDMREKLGDIRFYRGQFWQWEGSYWTEKPEHELVGHVIDNYGSLPACKKQGDYVAVTKTFKNQVTRPLSETTAIGINFGNGFLMHDGSLHEHSPSYGMTYRLPYCYKPELSGSCVRFFKFLEDAWGFEPDFELRKQALQEAICATLFGFATKMCRAILLYGVAHSGKSVLLRVVEGLFPAALVSAISPEKWSDKFAPAQLADKLLNIGGELHERKKIDGQIFKEVVDGSTVSGQHKNQQIFKFQPVCAHWFASNHLPDTDDTSGGFYRRWLILSFNREFPEAERNVNLVEELVAEEREAIVAWAVEAMPRLKINNAYTLPPSHDVEVQRLMANASDQLYFFLQGSQRVKVTPLTPVTGKHGGSTSIDISVGTLYEEYRSTIGSMGARPVSRAIFLGRMRQLSHTLGFREVTTTNALGFQETGYAGLTLVTARTGERAI